MSFYVKLIIVVLLLIALAEFIPEAVNTLLVVVLAGMLIMQSNQYARLISSLKF